MRAYALRVAQAAPFAAACAVPRSLGFRATAGAVVAFAVPIVLVAFLGLVTLSRWARRRGRVRARRFWVLASGATIALTLVVTGITYSDYSRFTFVYEHTGERRVAGAEHTANAARYLAELGARGPSELLADFGGRDELIWTPPSIQATRLRLCVEYLLTALALGAALFASAELAAEAGDRRDVPFPSSAPPAVARRRRERSFDVFLAHNSRDKPAIKAVAAELVRQGIVPWLDEWELRPGVPWSPILEEELGRVPAAAVLIGPFGIGPWQAMETSALLRQFVERGCPVIPVILSSVDDTTTPALPLFLGGMTVVDMRRSEPDPIRQLIFGVRGTNES